MTNHRPILSTNEIYHIFNRSNGRERVFQSARSLEQVFSIVNFYRFPQKISLSKFHDLTPDIQETYLATIDKEHPLVQIYTFALMPNHYHLLVKQLQDNGISLFLSKSQNSFAKYYNLVEDRRGGVFQSSFKANRITNNEEFIHVSRYIHLNPVTSKIISFKELLTSLLTSLSIYANNQNNRFVETKTILDYFGSADRYIKFVQDQEDYQKKLHIIKNKLIE